MMNKRRIIHVTVTLGIALGAGHLMQSSFGRTPISTNDVAQSRAVPKRIQTVSAGPAGIPVPVAAPMAAQPAAPALGALADFTDSAVAPAAPAAQVAATPEPAIPQPLVAAEDDCTPALSLRPSAQGMIALGITAPCKAGQRAVISHAGLVFAETLDDAGQLSLDVPALEPAARVMVLLEDASMMAGDVEIPEVSRLRRFGVQWMADDRFALSVHEDGAEWGAPGHVSAENPVSPSGGHVVSLGNPGLELPMLAEVYTWGAGAQSVEPTLEAEVSELSCGRQLLGTTIDAREGKVALSELSLAMPDCSMVGDILVLNNLVDDVTLTSVN